MPGWLAGWLALACLAACPVRWIRAHTFARSLSQTKQSYALSREEALALLSKDGGVTTEEDLNEIDPS